MKKIFMAAVAALSISSASAQVKAYLCYSETTEYGDTLSYREEASGTLALNGCSSFMFRKIELVGYGFAEVIVLDARGNTSFREKVKVDGSAEISSPKADITSGGGIFIREGDSRNRLYVSVSGCN
jgi:hypothetical protein